MAYRFVARRRTDRTASSVPSVSLSGGRATASQSLAQSIANQQARLQAVGETPKELDKTPTWLKVLTALDKPGSAARTGLLEIQKSANQEAKFESVSDAAAATKRMLEAGAKGLGTGWAQGEGAATGKDIINYALEEGTRQRAAQGKAPRNLQDSTAANLAPGLRDKVQAAGADKSGKTGNVAKEIGGFAVEALLDPLNLVSTGVGTVLKGVATKGGSKATREAAEALARAQLSRATGEVAERAAAKRVTKDMVEDLAWKTAQSAPGAVPGPVTAEALSAARTSAKELLGKQALDAETADRIAYALKKAGAKGTASTVDEAASMIADVKTAAAQRAAGPGLSIAGKTIVPEETLLKAGGKIRSGLERVPIVKNVVQGVDKVFNSRFIMGADAATQEVLYGIKQAAKRRKGALDAQTADMFMRQVKAVRDATKEFSGKARADAIQRYDRAIIDVLEGTRQPGEFPEQIAKVASELKDYYKRIGVEEYEAGILHNVMHDRYAPRIMSEEAAVKQAKGGIQGATLKVTSPSARKREMGNTIDEAQNRMRYKAAPIDEKEAFTEALYQHFGMAAPKSAAGEITTPYAADLGRLSNDLADDWAARQVAAGMDTEAAAQAAAQKVEEIAGLYETSLPSTAHLKAFSESGVASFLTRALQHNRVLAAKEFIDEAVAAFGQPVRSIRQAKALEAQGKQVVVRRTSLKNAVLLQAGEADELAKIGEALGEAGDNIPMEEVETAITKLAPKMQELVRNLFSDANGKSPLIKITPEQWELLSGQGSALLMRPIIAEAYAFDPNVLRAITDSATKQIDAASDTIGHAVDLLYSKWKPLVTGLKAGYHIRNYFGGMANNFLDVGMRAFDPRTSVKAADTLSKSDKLVIPGYTGKDLWDVALEKGVMQGTHAAEFSDEATRATEQRLYARMQKPGQTPLARAGEIAGALGDIPQKVGKKIGNVVEGQVRLTNFIANVEAMTAKGVPVEQAFDLAADSVRKFQFDYSDLTDAERTVLRRIFPFYTWMRNNIPLQVEQALNQPGKYVMFNRALKDFAPETDKEHLPEYMQETMAVPIPGTGTAQGSLYANLNLPMQDINNMLQPGKTITTSLNPLAKSVIELTMNKNALTGGPIWKETDPESVQFEKKRNYLIQQLGVLGVATRAGLETLGDKEAAAPGTKPVEAALPGIIGDITGLSSILKRYNVEPATEQDKYNLNTLLKNQIAQTEAERDIEVPTMAQLKRKGYQYVPRPSRRQR